MTLIKSSAKSKSQIAANAMATRLIAARDEIRARKMSRFFKTGPGEYGEGDLFLGTPNPIVRSLVKEFRSAAPADCVELLQSEYHEVRLLGGLLMTELFKRGDASTRRELYDAYLVNAERMNNWDLVDLTAPGIVGDFLLEATDGGRGVLFKLAASQNLWRQRIAVVSTLSFVRKREFSVALELADICLNHEHDLIHKATGWILREIGKRDRALLTDFLNLRIARMARVTLRYAIELYPESERRAFLKKRPFDEAQEASRR